MFVRYSLTFNLKYILMFLEDGENKFLHIMVLNQAKYILTFAFQDVKTLKRKFFFWSYNGVV